MFHNKGQPAYFLPYLTIIVEKVFHILISLNTFHIKTMPKTSFNKTTNDNPGVSSNKSSLNKVICVTIN